MKWILAFTLLLPLVSFANDCDAFKEENPVLAGGRVKPYLVLANESIKFLTGKSKFNDEAPTLTFCRLMLQQRTGTEFDFPILVEHVDSKKLLGVEEGNNTQTASSLVLKKDLIRSEIMKQKESNSFKKDLNKVWARVDLYEKIVSGNAYTVYTGSEENSGWSLLSNYMDQNLPELIESSVIKYKTEHDSKYMLEYKFAKSHLFSYAMLTALIGIFLAVLFKSMRWGVILAVFTLLIEAIGIAIRVIISGRAPITNMYETVLFSGFGALTIALIVLLFRKDKTFLLAGLGYNILCLFMMMFANNMLDSAISPLVPVLRDNFWLSTHVTTIILSYAALALSWLVANMTLVKMRIGSLTKADYRYYQDLTYTCIKIGIVLLAAGIILGGVWADYSWGRFWGWDPKETWSLIVLLFYMVIVHGRYSSWIDTHRFIVLSAAGFMTVMMAWFGVNYILASGLHSYGFSEGGAIFLGSFFLVQTIIILICGTKKNFKQVSA